MSPMEAGVAAAEEPLKSLGVHLDALAAPAEPAQPAEEAVLALRQQRVGAGDDDGAAEAR